MQETVILEADQVEESTDAVLKEHAIPAPLSEDMSHLILEDLEFEEDAEASDEESDADSDLGSDSESDDADGGYESDGTEHNGSTPTMTPSSMA